MTFLKQNLHHINGAIARACEDCQREPDAVSLLAVSKRHTADAISILFEAGQRAFGENYVQEAVEKKQALAALDIQWHLIGALQSNKARLAAETFDWVQTVDRPKIATALNHWRPQELPPLNVLIQVKISQESTKTGSEASEALDLATFIVNHCPRLKLRGLMAIPAAAHDRQTQYAQFCPVVSLFKTLQQRYPQCDTLSLGMSNDFEAAIAAGSTLVRIGTGLFGARQ